MRLPIRSVVCRTGGEKGDKKIQSCGKKQQAKTETNTEKHRGLHSVHSLVSRFLYVPSERWHQSVQTTVRAWAPPSPPCPVTRTFGSAIRDYERNGTRTTMQLQELTFRSRSLMNSSGRTTARVTVSLMASPSQPWPFFPPPLSPHAPLQYTT